MVLADAADGGIRMKRNPLNERVGFHTHSEGDKSLDFK
jgi:hypothetical protein